MVKMCSFPVLDKISTQMYTIFTHSAYVNNGMFLTLYPCRTPFTYIGGGGDHFTNAVVIFNKPVCMKLGAADGTIIKQ